MVIPLLKIKITHIKAATVAAPHKKSKRKVTAFSFMRLSANVSPIKQNLLMLPIKKQKAHKSKLRII